MIIYSVRYESSFDDDEIFDAEISFPRKTKRGGNHSLHVNNLQILMKKGSVRYESS